MSHIIGEHRESALRNVIKPGKPNDMFVTIHHVDGSATTTYAIDAKDAVTNHPETWSYDAWPQQQTS